MPLPWILCGILLVIAAAQGIKLALLRRSVSTLCEDLQEHLATDTNTLLSVDSNDRYVRRMAAELNRQLRLLREQRRQYQNGNREMRDAVTNISHDLRTPLTAICGYLELMEREELSGDAARYLALIGSRVDAMRQLTEELFRYSVILSTAGELKKETVDMAAVLAESAAGFYAALTSRGITPEITLPEEKVLRELDPGALRRVFGNVLNNALKYSDGDLEITLSGDGEIVFANTAAELDEVQVGKLFDRFFSVEAAQNSTGLGLAIAKTLVEQMGGEITAQYRDGRLSIHIAFPAIDKTRVKR